MSEAKPNQFKIKRADGTEEIIGADEVAVEQAPAWVFKKEGRVVRRVLKDEVTQQPEPSYPPTPEEAAEWDRVKTQMEAQNPRPRHQRPRQ